MTRAPAKAKKLGKTAEKVLLNRALVEGKRWLSIDPASGASSDCAVAQWHDCELLSVIRVPMKEREHYRKLVELSAFLRNTQAEELLAIEFIAPSFTSRGFNKLQHSVGAILSATKWAALLEIPAISWHATMVRRGAGRQYLKTDTNDAVAIGVCVLEILGRRAVLPAELEERLYTIEKATSKVVTHEGQRDTQLLQRKPPRGAKRKPIGT